MGQKSEGETLEFIVFLKSTRMEIILLKEVTKNYELGRTLVHALRGVNLMVSNGDFICISGPSGSGKTTLLNIAGCLDYPTSGKVEIMGEDISCLSDSGLSELRNKKIGFIFQTFNLIPILSAYENVEYPLLILGMSRYEREKQVLKMLDEVELLEYKKHKPDELSGGQRQRVAIARALVTAPKIVLADEPTANLDSKTGAAIIRLMKKMNIEISTTFIFSTHDQRVLQYAKKVYHLRDGKIYE